MLIHVLGAGAGGGFPQWNCNCDNCSGLRSGTLNGVARTQSSIAFSTNETEWVLVNVSPDIRTQIEYLSLNKKNNEMRWSPISSVILVDAQIDHTAGLMLLREGAPLEVHCTPAVRQELTLDYPVFNVLNNFCSVKAHDISNNAKPFKVTGGNHLQFTAISLPGRAPLYSRSRYLSDTQGHVIALYVFDPLTQGKVLYAPAIDRLTPELKHYMDLADVLFLDGTFWDEDELLRLNVSKRKASDMGHWALSGQNGFLNVLTNLKNKRIILTHINNTNPILNESSPEFLQLKEHGIEVARDRLRLQI